MGLLVDSAASEGRLRCACVHGWRWKSKRARRAGRQVPLAPGTMVRLLYVLKASSTRICCWPLNGSFLLKICGCTGRRVAEIVRA
jgi:hypothetical protein